ncbi:copper resistance D family protein [Anaerobacillus sp. MEB173]|uniref:copper resistance D family protein n=1 Tax=Anaerobacillus sp. MEB173 TaxID=3383345 RepID=UPI003F8EEDEC
MVIVSKALLYIVFAILIGGLVLSLIPKEKKPVLLLPKKWLYFMSFLIIILTSVPVFSVVQYITTSFNFPFATASKQVIFSYAVGKAWIITTILTCLLMVSLNLSHKLQTRVLNYVSLILAVALVFSAGWASHAASIDRLGGFIANSIHVLAISVWIGILFVVGWFSSGNEKWSAFLKWYTPLSICSVLVLSGTGLVLMQYIIPEYIHSWLLPYGQALLVKHILFFAIIIYGFSNGFLLKKKLLSNPGYQPQKWLRAESVFALAVFVITAVMTEQRPPHVVSQTLITDSPSRLFTLFYQGSIEPTITLQLTVSLLSIIFAIVALICLGFFIMNVRNQQSIRTSFLLSLLLVVSTYFTLMYSVQGETLSEDNTIYETIDEAIEKGYEGADVIEVLLVQPFEENFEAVVYHVNEEELVAELFLSHEDGYQRLRNAKLTIGGIPISESEHKIRTFIVTDGLWSSGNGSQVYVSFGIINDPKDVSSVIIHYEGEINEAEVVNQTFLNIVQTDEEWNPSHPIEFLSDDRQVIGGYMRGFMEEGVYCH